MKILTSYCWLGLALLNMLNFQVFDQTSGPRKPPPATRTSSSATTTIDRSVAPDDEIPAETKVINDVEITLANVIGSSVSQTIIANLRIKNTGGNTEICTQQAYTVDTDGNQYKSMSGRTCAPLYTDVPLKWTQGVKGIPAKTKNLALLTFSLYNKTTHKSVVAEFRDLAINWQ